MDDETFNLSIRKFLKMVGINSQREIERAVASGIADGSIKGTGSFPAVMTLEIAGASAAVRKRNVTRCSASANSANGCVDVAMAMGRVTVR